MPEISSTSKFMAKQNRNTIARAAILFRCISHSCQSTPGKTTARLRVITEHVLPEMHFLIAVSWRADT